MLCRLNIFNKEANSFLVGWHLLFRQDLPPLHNKIKNRRWINPLLCLHCFFSYSFNVIYLTFRPNTKSFKLFH